MTTGAILGWSAAVVIAICVVVNTAIQSRMQNRRIRTLERQRLVNIDETATKNKALLAELNVRSPEGFLTSVPRASEIWRQAVDCYVFGSYDASVTMAVRCLEIGIKRYNKAATDARLVDEIEKLAPRLDKNKDSAHSLRMMRNYVHTENLFKKPDALEALRRSAIILDDLFPLPPNPS